jgi:hypothetical protein
MDRGVNCRSLRRGVERGFAVHSGFPPFRRDWMQFTPGFHAWMARTVDAARSVAFRV